MMNKVIICFLSIWVWTISTTNAQQGTVGSGGDATGSGGTTSYTVGQPFYTVKGSSATTTDGLQQPYEFYISVDKIKGIDLAMKTFPNPTVELLYLEIEELLLDNLQWRLFDANGKLISQQGITGNISAIPLQKLTAGAYILQVSQQEQTIKSFTIIKNQL